MQEAIDGFWIMPGWVQVAVTLFALTFLAMVFGPKVTQRRARQHFAALAQTRHARVVPGHDVFTASFSVEQAGRTFTVQRELRSTTRGGSYRGPRGHLIVIETPLAHSRWKMHGVDIAQRGALARLGGTPVRSGDAVFDKRFTIWQDGVLVRENWIDGTTRAAVTAFFDLPSIAGAGTVWVQEGRLHYLNDAPATLDETGLTAILEQQAALAAALEATASGRVL
ncbi:MAG: hypothetical protein ABI039_00655 [Vicinamibacterales bacterium]